MLQNATSVGQVNSYMKFVSKHVNKKISYEVIKSTARVLKTFKDWWKRADVDTNANETEEYLKVHECFIVQVQYLQHRW